MQATQKNKYGGAHVGPTCHLPLPIRLSLFFLITPLHADDDGGRSMPAERRLRQAVGEGIHEERRGGRRGGGGRARAAEVAGGGGGRRRVSEPFLPDSCIKEEILTLPFLFDSVFLICLFRFVPV